MALYLIDGDGNVLHDGDRVYTHDPFENKRIYGELHEPEEMAVYPDTWTVSYDDGESSLVLRPEQLFKA